MLEFLSKSNNLIKNFDRFIGLKDGRIVIDKSTKGINILDLDWIF